MGGILILSGGAGWAVAAPSLVKALSAPNQLANEAKAISNEDDAPDGIGNEPVEEFLRLPPEERVRLWLKTTDWDFDIHNALVVAGLDTVPLLAKLVHQDDKGVRKRALKLLCAMDRFVPDEELPLPEAGGMVYVKPLKKGGRYNYFMLVDGRRIGKTGLDAVLWAAEQTKHDDLRFHARYSAGLLEGDLRKLSLKEQLSAWRKAVIDSKGSLGLFGNFRAHATMNKLELLLTEQALDSIPALVEMLERDASPYVREEAIEVLAKIDSHRMRLRTSELGRQAIDAIHRALERGGLKPDLEKREYREDTWKQLSAEFFNDEFMLHDGSNWAITALAFEQFYGEQTTKRYYTVQELIEAKPEIRQFVTYLTQVDPYFPSWEYVYVSSLSQDEVLHPRFKAKMARYHEYWKRFKAQQAFAKP